MCVCVRVCCAHMATLLHPQCIHASTGAREQDNIGTDRCACVGVCVCVYVYRVIAWEPVPHNRAFLASNLAINNLTNLVTVRPQVVSDEDKKLVTMLVRGLIHTHTHTHTVIPHTIMPCCKANLLQTHTVCSFLPHTHTCARARAHIHT